MVKNRSGFSQIIQGWLYRQALSEKLQITGNPIPKPGYPLDRPFLPQRTCGPPLPPGPLQSRRPRAAPSAGPSVHSVPSVLPSLQAPAPPSIFRLGSLGIIAKTVPAALFYAAHSVATLPQRQRKKPRPPPPRKEHYLQPLLAKTALPGPSPPVPTLPLVALVPPGTRQSGLPSYPSISPCVGLEPTLRGPPCPLRARMGADASPPPSRP